MSYLVPRGAFMGRREAHSRIASKVLGKYFRDAMPYLQGLIVGRHQWLFEDDTWTYTALAVYTVPQLVCSDALICLIMITYLLWQSRNYRVWRYLIPVRYDICVYGRTHSDVTC